MNWNQRFPKEQQPSLEEIDAFIDSPLWGELRRWAEERYAVSPKVEHSTCSGAPGWNVKYKKSGRSLCTLYPEEGAYTALISVGAKEMPQAELLLPTCSDYVRKLFSGSAAFNGGRWLMIRVSDARVLEDVKRLISLRVAPKE